MKKFKIINLAVVLAFSLFLLLSINAKAVSDDAKKHFDRGMAAVEMEDYEAAIREFEKAKSIATNWADVYYNLGLTQEKTGEYGNAIINLKKYLRLSPKAQNASEIKSLVNKLEYKKEKADNENNLKNMLRGEWIANHSPRRGFMQWPVQFILEEDSIYLYAPMVDYQQTSFTNYKKNPVKLVNNNIIFMVVWEQSIRGFKKTSKEEIKFNLNIVDSRKLEGAITYTPIEGWSYPQQTQKVVFLKK